jgi:hypothetical protein
VSRQQPLQTARPQRQQLPLRVQPIHPIGQFLLPQGRGLVRPYRGLAQGRQLGYHRRVLAVVLRGHAVEDLGIVMGGLGADAAHLHVSVVEGLPQGIAVGARRLQGHAQLSPLSQLDQQADQLRDLFGVEDTPGPTEVRVAPAGHGQDLVLADVATDNHRLALPSVRQLVQLDAVDGDRRVCFAFAHGDDLLLASS